MRFFEALSDWVSAPSLSLNTVTRESFDSDSRVQSLRLELYIQKFESNSES